MFGAARIATYDWGGGGSSGGAAPAGPSYDITTATTGFTGTARIGDQEGTPSDLYFSSDGTKMYTIGTGNDRVNEYVLSTAWNVFTASYSTFISVVTQETSPNGLAFSTDGTKMYVVGQGQDTVFQYTLSTAWLVSSATYASKSVVVSQGGTETVPTAVEFSDDGTTMYVVGSTLDTVHQYTLSTAWDVSTATYASKSFSVTTQSSQPQGVRFADSGTKMYIMNQTSVIYQYALSTAWDVSTASYGSVSFNLSTIGGYETNAVGIYIKPDGTRAFMVGTTYDYVWSLNIGTAYNISTASFSTTDNYRLGANDPVSVGIKFSNNGLKFFALGTNADRVYEYSCSTAWDINTATYTGGRFISVGTQEANGQDLAFGDSGTKMYIIGTTSDTIYQYTLSTGFLITTATYASKSFSVSTQESFPTGLVFNNDGTKFYVVGEGASRIFQYSCSTAWDISTASYDSISLLVSGQVTTPQAVAWANAGAKFYVLGQGNDLIAQYTLSTPFDISTATFDTGKTLSILNVDHQAFAMAIGSNGTKLYVVGQNIDRMIQYTLT
jgi:sugar lactone lactonase YvrE